MLDNSYLPNYHQTVQQQIDHSSQENGTYQRIEFRDIRVKRLKRGKGDIFLTYEDIDPETKIYFKSME